MPQVPDNPQLSAPTQLPQLDASAQTIGQAAQQVGKAVAGIGDEAGRLALQLQDEDDKATLADQRILIRKEEAKLNEWIIKHAKHPSVWIEEANRRMRGVMDGVVSGRLLQEGTKISPALRRELEAQGKVLTSSVIRRAGDKAAMAVAHNAKAKRDYEIDQMRQNRDYDGMARMAALPEVSEEEELEIYKMIDQTKRESIVTDTLPHEMARAIRDVEQSQMGADDKAAVLRDLRKRHEIAQSDAIDAANDVMKMMDAEQRPMTRDEYEDLLRQSGAFVDADYNQDHALIQRISANNYLGKQKTPLSTDEVERFREKFAAIRRSYMRRGASVGWWNVGEKNRETTVRAWEQVRRELLVEGAARVGDLIDELNAVHPDSLEQQSKETRDDKLRKKFKDYVTEQMSEWDERATTTDAVTLESWDLIEGQNYVPVPKADPDPAKRSDADNLKISKKLGITPPEAAEMNFLGWYLEGKTARGEKEAEIRGNRARLRALIKMEIEKGLTIEEAETKVNSGAGMQQKASSILGTPSGVVQPDQLTEQEARQAALLPEKDNPLGGAPP